MRRRIKLLYKALIKFNYRCFFWVISTVPIFNLYQPIFGRTGVKATTRVCDDRWDLMGPVIAQKKGVFLDIGCNIGYFSFKAAEIGCYSYGVEANDFNLTCCNAIKTKMKVNNCSFIKGLVDDKFVEQMPAFDTILNLSVFHHWVKAYGADKAQNMMRQLAQKCSTLIFETGQSDEVNTKWADQLTFMGDKPKEWIENFLFDIGFKEVNVIGSFPTGLTQVNRYLFVATK